ncbi:MAG: 50S ribosomal protein L6 [Nitrospirae bacterium GWD2_57_9]|nr:MAG: 50S ribosomal protein L6 [Nitrospirae bacterium GWD2_57_9]OGW47444.1 MAG: 50S ribosomal protein L6 [Nitrospirae bacterium GWC2_57_9]
MSRVGKKPIEMPAGVEAKLETGKVTVKGPLGEISQVVNPKLTIKKENNKLLVERPSDQKIYREMHGLTRNLIANMVHGVSKGYEKTLEISGVGFKAQAQGANLMLTLGFSHPIVYPIPKGIKATVDTKQTQITLKGVDKQLIGQIAANLRSLKKPEPYKGKGIKYSTEVIQRKEGKAGKGGK